jgi:tRNA (guanine-N7-)-methyltransferase
MNDSLKHSAMLRSFGRIRGRKLRTHAQELMEGLLPQIGIRLEALGISGFPNPLYLEIGFGGGEHLAHMAALHPDISFIGCEPYVNGISGLLKEIEQKHLQNIRIYTDDVRELLAMMPDACLDRVYILYPDPWPKARHHKRRLIQKPLLDLLARVMKPGAELRIATDWDDYATWILEQLLPHPAFRWTGKRAADWTQAWEEWIPTRYEQKARREGRTSTYFRFVRQPISSR